MKNEIIIFDNQDIKLEVNMKDETVWLSLEQMSKLFERDRTVITRHINNIFKDNELIKEEVCAKFAHTTIHGSIEGKTQTRALDYYNLDMIISVGYRVNSKRGIAFRKWATNILKDYMLKGYAVNSQRLEYLERTVALIDIANRMDERLEHNDEREILRVIGEYAKALDLLDDYDHKTLKKIKGSTSAEKIDYTECMEIVGKLKFNEKSNLFAIERNEGLKSIIEAIYQTFDSRI